MTGPFTQRRRTPELMDDAGADPAQLDRSLRFIRAVNRRLGGVSAVMGPLRRWLAGRAGGETVRIIDIGTGSADIPLAITRWGAAAGRPVHVTAVDSNPVTLGLARRHVGEAGGIELVQGDALRLVGTGPGQFEPGSFDYAHAGMFLHHLDDIEVMTVLRIMERLTTHGMIWNDLVRGPVEKLAVRLLVLGRPAMVRHDAVVSVAVGFTRREALDLAARVGLPNVKFRRHLFGRFALTSVKKSGQ